MSSLAERSSRVAVCFFNHFCSFVWKPAISIASWMMEPHFLSLCIYASGNPDSDLEEAGRDSSGGATSAKLSTSLDSRTIFLTFLNDLQLSDPETTSFFNSLVMKLLKGKFKLSLNSAPH